MDLCTNERDLQPTQNLCRFPSILQNAIAYRHNRYYCHNSNRKTALRLLNATPFLSLLLLHISQLNANKFLLSTPSTACEHEEMLLAIQHIIIFVWHFHTTIHKHLFMFDLHKPWTRLKFRNFHKTNIHFDFASNDIHAKHSHIDKLHSNPNMKFIIKCTFFFFLLNHIYKFILFLWIDNKLKSSFIEIFSIVLFTCNKFVFEMSTKHGTNTNHHMICQLEKEFHFGICYYAPSIFLAQQQNWYEVQIAKACTHKNGNAIPKRVEHDKSPFIRWLSSQLTWNLISFYYRFISRFIVSWLFCGNTCVCAHTACYSCSIFSLFFFFSIALCSC